MHYELPQLELIGDATSIVCGYLFASACVDHVDPTRETDVVSINLGFIYTTVGHCPGDL